MGDRGIDGLTSTWKGGGFVARQRPDASDLQQPVLICLDGGRPEDGGPQLTSAEARALRRSAPLTHAQLTQHLEGVADPEARPS